MYRRLAFLPLYRQLSKQSFLHLYSAIAPDSQSFTAGSYDTLRSHTRFFNDSVVPKLSTLIQHGDNHVLATILRGMNETFRDMILKDVIIYNNDIIMASATYKGHVDALRRVLQRLQDQQFCLTQSNCQFCKRHLAFLLHVLIPD